jgi:3',5'-cyclic AMP phosphodiesterase CpdA
VTGFVQIADTHILAPGALSCGRWDTARALRRAVEMVNTKLPLLGWIHCAMVTGDPTDQGTVEEYAHFLSIMEGLGLPWLAIPGNHDQRAPMRAAFAQTSLGPTASARSSPSFAFTRRFGVLFLSCMPNSL